MNIKRFFLLIFLLIGISFSGLAQQVDRVKMRPLGSDSIKVRSARVYYGRMGLDSTKASLVDKIYREYKSGLASLSSDTSLSAEGKKAKLVSLQRAKNVKLRKLLNAEQQRRLIPTTEQ